MGKTHTPGPWSDGIHHARTQGGRTYAHIGNGKDLVPIAAVVLGVEGYGREEGEANARVIAAAPELLGELKRMVEHFGVFASDHSMDASTETWAALHCAKEIISKAEGRL